MVVFKDSSLQQTLQKDVAKLKQKLQRLKSGVASGAVARYNRAMCYRAIRPLARFHSDYQAANEVLLDSKTLESSSVLSFATVKRGGSFHTHPAMIDALTQSCGFAMNCNDTADLDEDVFMNHGWGSLQLFEPINFVDEYTTYTRMIEGADKLWHGDVVVMNGNDKVVAHFGQIAVRLDFLIPLPRSLGENFNLTPLPDPMRAAPSPEGHPVDRRWCQVPGTAGKTASACCCQGSCS